MGVESKSLGENNFFVFFCHLQKKRKENTKIITPKCYFYALLTFFLSFFPLLMEKDKKLVFMQKQMISTSKRPAEHPFAGQNTQALEVSSIFSHGPLESWST